MFVQAPHAKGFTLVELLVTVSIIAVLLSVLIPSVNSSRRQAKVVACGANLRSIGQLIHAYTQDNDGRIPRGPSCRSPALQGAPKDVAIATSQVWMQYVDPGPTGPNPPPCRGSCPAWDLNGNSMTDGQYLGLGLLTRSGDAQGNKFLYCPADDKRNFEQESAKIGRDGEDAFSSYLYRQMDMAPPEIECEGKLDDLRFNSGTSVPTPLPGSGSAYRLDIHALALDMNALGGGVNTTTNHKSLRVNVVYKDGSVSTFDNKTQLLDNLGGESPWATITQAALFTNPLAALDRIFLAADFSFLRPEPWLAPVP